MTAARDENVQALAQVFGRDMGDANTRITSLDAHPSYGAALSAVKPADLRSVAAIVGQFRVVWRPDPTGTCLGGGWSPADMPTPQHWNGSLADAVLNTAGGTVRIDYDEQSIPSNHAGVLLEYTKQATARNITQTGWWPDTALRTLRAQHPAGHPDQKQSTLNIEMLADGSGKNGPYSSDYGMSINAAKRGYATGAAVSGEIDGLTIYVRQDGARGLPLGSTQSSDACGILINAQNVEDVGFVAPIEATSSNISGVSPFGYRRRIQAQMAPITPNAPGGMISYGHVVVAKDGANNHAYYAGAEGAATWATILHSPERVSVTWDGEYRILTPDWASGAARFARGRAVNDALTIINRGTGGVLVNAQEAGPISFATANVERMRINAAGHLVPASGQSPNLGDPGSRFAALFTGQMNSNGAVTMTNLPVHADNAAALAAGLTAGRVYRTATGQMMVVY